MDVPAIISQVRQLSIDDQVTILLAFRERESAYVWSLISEEDRRELDRRLDADDAGELPGEPWEVVRRRLGWDRPAGNG
jgi:hypothetical protein